MKIAVTGANGHVGYNLCKTLSEKGHSVCVLSHDHTNGLDKLNARQVKGDLMDKDSLKKLLDGAEIVYHLAAKISIRGDKDGSVYRINAEGTRNMVETAKECGVRRFIHFSSIHAFRQDPLDQILDETRPLVKEQAFSYDRSKADGERIVMDAAREGLDAVVICPTAIIGPEDLEPSLVGKAVIQLYNRQIPSLVPGGYNWVDVRDIISGAIAAIDKGRIGEKYLLSGNWHSILELSQLIEKLTGKKTPQMVFPFWTAKLGLPFTTIYSRLTGKEPLYTSESLVILENGSRHISHDKATRELGYSPRSLESTLKDLIDWFIANGILK
jgi:dihydroflavonol-4-reductase